MSCVLLVIDMNPCSHSFANSDMVFGYRLANPENIKHHSTWRAPYVDACPDSLLSPPLLGTYVFPSRLPAHLVLVLVASYGFGKVF